MKFTKQFKYLGVLLHASFTDDNYVFYMLLANACLSFIVQVHTV